MNTTCMLMDVGYLLADPPMASIILVNIKQEADGSHCSEEKQFFAIKKLAQSYHYTYTLVKKSNVTIWIRYVIIILITPPLWKEAISHEQTWVSWKNIKPELDNICSLLCYYMCLPWGKCVVLHLKKNREGRLVVSKNALL